MKRTILTALVAIGAGAMCVMAQAGGAPAAAAQPAKKTPSWKSKAELEALQALAAAANDPDKAIAAAEALITKFADTDYKAFALFVEATAYQQKGDTDHMVIFAERTLDADPSDFRAALMLGNYYATHTKETDLDKEEKLVKAEKYANQGLELLKTASNPNPGQVTDAQWMGLKKDSEADGYNTIGLANLTRKKYDPAAAAFKSASDSASQPEPTYMVRAASMLQSGGKNDEAIVWCDKALAVPNVHPQVKAMATQIRAAAVRAGGKAPGGEAK